MGPGCAAPCARLLRCRCALSDLTAAIPAPRSSLLTQGLVVSLPITLVNAIDVGTALNTAGMFESLESDAELSTS